MAQDAGKIVPCRWNRRSFKVRPKRQGNAIASRTVDGTVVDRDHALGAAFEMPHDEATASRPWREYEGDLLAKPGRLVSRRKDREEERR